MDNLARSAGGNADIEKAIFKNKNDKDFQEIVACIKQIMENLKKKPRMDMPGARSAQKNQFGFLSGKTKYEKNEYKA